MSYQTIVKMKRTDIRFVQAHEKVYKRTAGYPEYHEYDIEIAKTRASMEAFGEINKEIYNKTLPKKFSCDFEIKQEESAAEAGVMEITANIVVYTKEAVEEKIVVPTKGE